MQYSSDRCVIPIMLDASPYIIAGPCSVESREQLMAVVTYLSAMPQVRLIRCGVWKPRTRPGGFEGLGEQALRWMQKLQPQLPKGVGFACEVAMPEHVELALKYGVRAVWIGARTTANPFMVQELTQAMKGSDIKVLVKNAPSPDVKLWVGAIERCYQAGLKEVCAVHRGFDMLQNGSYRNSPLWEVPIELRRLMPEIPIITDPSHIAGCKEPIQHLSQTALDLGFDGLMVEVHPHPEQALTDAKQQLTPQELQALLTQLVIRQTDSTVADQQLQLLREQIDCLDQQLLQTLVARQQVGKEIAKVKAEGNLAVFQPKRWDALLQQRLQEGETLGLSTDYVKELFETIHAESVRVQQVIIDNK